MRKKLLLLLCVIVVAATGVLVAVWLRPEPVASQARCERVRLGMTQAEVEVLLGGPPGEYQTGPVHYCLDSIVRCKTVHRPGSWPGEQFYRQELWESDHGGLTVYFGEENEVVGYEYMPSSDLALLDKFRRWLGI